MPAPHFAPHFYFFTTKQCFPRGGGQVFRDGNEGVPEFVWRNDGNSVVLAAAEEHIGAVVLGSTPKN